MIGAEPARRARVHRGVGSGLTHGRGQELSKSGDWRQRRGWLCRLAYINQLAEAGISGALLGYVGADGGDKGGILLGIGMTDFILVVYQDLHQVCGAGEIVCY